MTNQIHSSEITENQVSEPHCNECTSSHEAIQVDSNTNMAPPQEIGGQEQEQIINNQNEKSDDPEHKKSKPGPGGGHKKGGKHGRKPHVRSPFKEYMNSISHICIFSYTVLIVYLCVTHEFKFFTWHPLLLSIGWAFGMTQSILTLSRDNIIFSGHSHQFQKKVHWLILIPAGILILIGFIVAYLNKDYHDPPKQHFTSWHAIFGLIGLVASIPPYINGTLLWWKEELADYFNGRFIKFIHILTGIISFFFGSISVFLSVYTKWFGRNTNHMDFIFYFALVTSVFPVLWSLYKPTMMTYRTIANRLN